MKIASRAPTCTDRYPVRLTAPVAFDGRVVHAGDLVELSDSQAVEIIFHERGVPASESELAAGNRFVARPRAVMEWADDTMSPRQRKKWRPSRVGSNRVAPRGSVRIDAGGSIFEQVREFVGR